MKHRLLLVDDELFHLESTVGFLEKRGLVVEPATSGEEAIEKVRANPYLYSLVILDYRMEGRDGASTAEAMSAINPDLFILMFSGDSSRDAIKLSQRSGARGFVDKSDGKEVFLSEVRRWCGKFEQTHLPVNSREVGEQEALISKLAMVGRSGSLAAIANLVGKIRDKNGSVLILGESGTGKELIARALHCSSRGLFRAVNCGAFATNPQLMASMLFGHTKGAFTGATLDKKGIFEEVNGGTVFLDEVYALPLSAQIELLRTLQEKTITPVGATREVPVRFRLVSAAKPDLLSGLSSGVFKPDLFYRIAETTISVPPLRERPEDIQPLVEWLCTKWCETNHETKTFLMRTVPYLENYSWPGNVRELENVVNHVLNITTESKIAPEHLDAKFFTNPPSAPRLFPTLKSMMEDSEKQYIIEVLSSSRSVRDAARKLCTSHANLLRLTKKFHLNAKELLRHASECSSPVEARKMG